MVLVIHIINKAACVGSKHDDQDNDKMNTLEFNHLLLVKIFSNPEFFSVKILYHTVIIVYIV